MVIIVEVKLAEKRFLLTVNASESTAVQPNDPVGMKTQTSYMPPSRRYTLRLMPVSGE
jgi:hypothetical protein